MSRVLNIGTKKHTLVNVIDERGQGNANHYYVVQKSDPREVLDNVLCHIHFQNGPVAESGVNGIHNEDLIAIVIDRLRGFQSGDYACRDNALALTKLEEALFWLRNRTNERELRGVEGTHVK